MIFSILVVLVFIVFSQSVYANESEIILTIPPKMIVDESYEGMIILLQPLNIDTTGMVSSGNDFVLVTDGIVKIPTNKNHGIFSIILNQQIF